MSRKSEPIRDKVRITSQGKVKSYVTYVEKQLQLDHQVQLVSVKPSAINKTITVTEILKRLQPGLHQINELKSQELDRGEFYEAVAILSVTLSKTPLDSSNPGYQYGV